MDGIQEASNQSDSAVSNASVSCVVALLGTLEDLSNGHGLSDENIEMLRKLKEPDNIQELSGNFLFYLFLYFFLLKFGFVKEKTVSGISTKLLSLVV